MVFSRFLIFDNLIRLTQPTFSLAMVFGEFE